MSTTMQNIDFNKNLARLFYAIAASDKRVHETEIRSLKKLLRTCWIDILNNNSDSEYDQLYQIELEFDRLVEEHSDPIKCFDDFVDFRYKNQEFFSREILKLIWKTANTIALSFSGRNKSELILLTKLKLNLQQ